MAADVLEGAEKVRQERQLSRKSDVAILVVAESQQCVTRFINETQTHLNGYHIFIGHSSDSPLHPESSSVTVRSYPNMNTVEIHNSLVDLAHRSGFKVAIVSSESYYPLQSSNISKLIDPIMSGVADITSPKSCLDVDFCTVAPR